MHALSGGIQKNCKLFEKILSKRKIITNIKENNNISDNNLNKFEKNLSFDFEQKEGELLPDLCHGNFKDVFNQGLLRKLNPKNNRCSNINQYNQIKFQTICFIISSG